MIKGKGKFLYHFCHQRGGKEGIVVVDAEGALVREINIWERGNFSAGVCSYTYFFFRITISVANIYRKALNHTHIYTHTNPIYTISMRR